jgi:hypothetical protein
MRSVARFIAAAAVAAAITLPMASSTLATVNGSSREAGVAFLQGVKTCSAPSTTPPQIVCRMTTSNVALLQGASVAYTSVPAILADPAPGRIDSDILLTTAAGTGQSSANGHCTFYFSTGTGVCTYRSGTRDLAGFHAVLVIGTIDPNAGTYSFIGKYWFGGDDQSD